MTKYKLLMLDFDGTTLDEKKKFPVETMQAIKKLTAAGVTVCAATGRGLAELTDYREEVKYFAYGDLISGGMVYDFAAQKPLYTLPLKTEDAMQILDDADEERAMIHILTVDSALAKTADIFNMNDFSMGIYQDMYERICTRAENTEELKDFVRKNPADVLKINLYHRSPQSRARSREKLKHLDVESVFAEVTGLEFSPKGITKATGFNYLCKHLGIDPKDTVAIGDAPNDREILQAAGLGIAMGNAADEIKATADDVTLTNKDNGVLAAINKYF